MPGKKATEKTVEFPEGTEIEVEGRTIKAKLNGKEAGKKYKFSRIKFSKKGNSVVLKAKTSDKKMLATLNSVASNVKNLAEGLEKGYKYRLAVVYSHFPMNVAVKDGFVEISNFTGEKKARKARIVDGAEVQVKGKEVEVKGIDKEAVGQTAANIEKATKISGRDKRVFQDGIYLTEKGFAEEKRQEKAA